MYKVNKFTKTSQAESYFGPTSLMTISGPDSKNRPAPFSSPTVKKQIFSCENKLRTILSWSVSFICPLKLKSSQEVKHSQDWPLAGQ